MASLQQQLPAQGPPIATFERVTSDIAAAWLAQTNPYNRKLSKATWKRYANDLVNQNFILNPADAICFDWNGRLMNGQHRLTACVETGVAFEALVVRNCDPDSFVAMDSGKGRTAADDLHLMGQENPVAMATVARLICLDDRKSLGNSSAKVSRSDIQAKVVKAGREIKESLAYVGNLDLPAEISTARAAFCYLRFARQDMAKAKTFFAALSERTGLQPGSPVLLLPKALQGYTKRKQRLGERDVLGLTFKAWVMFRDDRKGSVLQLRKNEEWAQIDQKVVPLKDPRETKVDEPVQQGQEENRAPQ